VSNKRLKLRKSSRVYLFRTPKAFASGSIDASLPALLPSPLGSCDLCRGVPARSIHEQARWPFY
jgi:hypothetical protein